MSSMPAGWYPDPFSSGGYVRWWDGERWGQSTALEPGQAPPPPPSGARRQPGQAQPAYSWTTPDQARAAYPTGAQASGDVAFDGTYLASYGQRVLAFLLDVVIQSVVLVPLIIWLEGPLYADLSAALDANGGQLTQAMFDSLVKQAQQNSLSLTIATLLVTGVYVIPQVALYGRTLGKRAVGLRVRSLAGAGDVTWRQSIIRWSVVAVGWSICSVLLVVDFLWPLWDKPARQAVHDKGARTIVVKDRA
jgi:uncharacterized RDD family membrane protein YckC